MNWIYYGLGYLGLMIYIGTGAMEAYGKQLSAVSKYVTGNALPLIITALCYNAVVCIWLWTDIGPAIGLEVGKLNALTIPVGYMAQSIFTKSVRVYAARGKSDEPPTDPKP